jgi:hypothetical protein
MDKFRFEHLNDEVKIQAMQIPPRSSNGWGNVFGADVSFGETFLVGHRAGISFFVGL